MKRYVIILSLHDLVHELSSRHELSIQVLKDLIELVTYCQIDSVRANGIETIYSQIPTYINPLDLISEDLHVAFADIHPAERMDRLKIAAIQALQELPSEDTYFHSVNDLRDPKLNVRWLRTDLILEVS